ncbi:ABC transporter substrate-binding protein [Paenibacillus swuensis]|uniref:ABC transporter substrate-binding protein n=2 Tax=Paenibacillus swuensis TaxID=1178515 RepID=A0A172TNR9_9BACL|nr:ABC transporter substrate-binding protein [Paenibacillus swuensis]
MRKTWLVVLMLMIAFTTACSNGGNGENTNGNVGQAAANSEGNAAGNGNAAAAPEGNTVDAANAEPGWKEDTSPITLDWYVNFSWASKDWGKTVVTKYITKKTGVNLKMIIPAGNEIEKLNTMIASGKLPDLLTISWSEDVVKQLIDSGMVLPLNELAKEYDPYFFKVTDPAKLAWYTQEDGNVYGLPNYSVSPMDYKKYGDTYTSNQTFIVRKDMYEALGKPDMRTPEGFLGALKAAKEKYPKVNGQPLIPLGLTEFHDKGSYSMMNGDKLDSLLQNFLAIPMAKDGKVYDRTTDPEFIKWMKVFRQANEEGLLSKEVFIDKRQQMDEKFTQGRYFASLYQANDMAGQNEEIYRNDKNRVYIAVDGPANAEMTPPTLYGPGISGWTLTLISKNVKNKERAIKFLSYLVSEEGQRDFYLGEKGVTYDTIDGKDQILPKLLEEKKKSEEAYFTKYGLEGASWLGDSNILQQWQPPSKDPVKQPRDWTKGKLVDFSAFELTMPGGMTPEGVKANKISLLWGDTLPKLMLAKTEADFDKLWDTFIKKRDSLGFKEVEEYRQKRYEENLKKLEKFSE